MSLCPWVTLEEKPLVSVYSSGLLPGFSQAPQVPGTMAMRARRGLRRCALACLSVCAWGTVHVHLSLHMLGGKHKQLCMLSI